MAAIGEGEGGRIEGGAEAARIEEGEGGIGGEGEARTGGEGEDSARTHARKVSSGTEGAKREGEEQHMRKLKGPWRVEGLGGSRASVGGGPVWAGGL